MENSDIQFQRQLRNPTIAEEVQKQWNILCSGYNFDIPYITYGFYGYGLAPEEKMIIIEDSRSSVLSPVIFAVKLVNLTDGTKRSSTYAIVRSKTVIVEIVTGRVITFLKDTEEQRFEKLQAYFNENVSSTTNPYNQLAYYIPNSSLINFHVIDHEKASVHEDDLEKRIGNIHKADTFLEKRQLFGYFMMSKYWNAIFNVEN
jgi:hypothetical protein